MVSMSSAADTTMTGTGASPASPLPCPRSASRNRGPSVSGRCTSSSTRSNGSTRSFAEALAKLRVEPFDLVLLDVHRPETDGPRFLEALRGQGRGDAGLAPVPVIVVSAADDIETIAQCLELGADDYLP